MSRPRLVPELTVENFEKSLRFYIDGIGFKIVYATPEHRYAYLDYQGSHLMLEETPAPDVSYHKAAMEKPYGRGMSLRIQTDDVDAMYVRLTSIGTPVIIDMRDSWYRQDDHETGNREFVVADPDGYLLRFFKDLGTRKSNNA